MRTVRFALLLGVSLALTACGDKAPTVMPTSSNTLHTDAAVPGKAEERRAPQTASIASIPESGPLSCSVEVGDRTARTLVDQCIAVSPATHPPCNAANSCAMIRNEIARGCAILGEDAGKTPECGGVDPFGKAAAADLIDRYYDAINARDFSAAYALWGPDGGTSGQTLQQFSQGFDHTRRVTPAVGPISDVEGAAGSLYVTVPVTLEAQTTDSGKQRFSGTYILRQINRGMGTSQGWHIERASLKPA